MHLETHASKNACVWKCMRLEMHASPDASMNPIFPDTIFSSYERTCTPTVPSGHWLASLLVQHALSNCEERNLTAKRKQEPFEVTAKHKGVA